MTVQEFIVNYNETFQYLHDRFGKADVVALWDFLADTNVELYEKVKEGGLEGYLDYFYGEAGLSAREDVMGGVGIGPDGAYRERIVDCPSVSEMEERGKRPYRYYCEHCYWLYRKALEENGFTYDAYYELQPKDAGYCKDCHFCAKKKEAAV